jgi:hypothetical protein
MPLTSPDFILRTGIADEPVTHTWDDSDPDFAYVGMDERLQHRIDKTTYRGVLALSAGVAEWIAWRFHKVSSDSLLFDKIEAVWAGIIDWRYLSGNSLPVRHDWQGPVRGPLWSAASWLDQVIGLLKRKQFASPEAVCLSQLLLHVTVHPDSFKDWRRFAIGRLAKLYPEDDQNRLGAPLPRQVMDPDIKFDPAMAPALLDTFLRGLDPARNPFLASPADMVASGFTDTPYTYS